MEIQLKKEAQQLLLQKQKTFETIIKDSELKIPFMREMGFAMMAIENNPAIMKCSPESIQNAFVQIALTGLSLNPKLGYCYLIPRRGKCVLDVSYKGMAKTVTDTGSVINISATCVYSNDDFVFSFGLNPTLVHHPKLSNRGDLIAVYSVATLSNGSKNFIVMTKEEVEEVKKMSRGGNIWNDWEGEMLKKTVIKRHAKTLPQSERMILSAEAFHLDNKNNFEDKKQKSDFFENIEEVTEIEEENQKL